MKKIVEKCLKMKLPSRGELFNGKSHASSDMMMSMHRTLKMDHTSSDMMMSMHRTLKMDHVSSSDMQITL